MKSKERVKAALKYHVEQMELCTEEQLKGVAKALGWNIEYFNGYREGVKWAYEWILKDE